ncbi:ASCH domain-containing protein [Streptococcaceae bacterium ESL0729]|nr:ASCH domain-containing protein [Streptococcaceae bacterium ESL0729]
MDENKKVADLWNEFLDRKNLSLTGTTYDAWQFGVAPDELAQLVLEGKKTATASAYDGYDFYGERIPQVDDYSIILDSKNHPLCIIRTRRVKILKFSEIDKNHAFKEGEGDLSLGYWQREHQKFFAKELRDYGKSFSEEMKVVAEEFEVVYLPDDHI